MALMDFIKKQFIDILQWTEDSDGTLAWRFPMAEMEIQNGASLTVRESQQALFVDEGVAADVFGPGRHRLSTATLPLLTNLRHWDKLFASPFKSDVYFFSTRLQLDRTWGTATPIVIRDAEFGAVRLRAYGIYAYRLSDPLRFHQKVSGTRERYGRDDLEGQLRNTLVAGLSTLFAESGIPFLDLAANQEALGRAMRERAAPMFADLGLELESLVVQNFSLPDELQKTLDQRISMGMLGDLQRYTQFQVASSIPDAARNEGGLAAMGAGLGFGQMIGQAMAGATMPAAAAGTDEIVATLEKLHALVGKGVLSQAEFDAKKEELLKKLG
jgi:membrane protease subunit (stomatin/prohibitin family)